MTNHLAQENSPYLLQHADNPVEWYPWGEEALTRARTEDKPIFLSIGYAACHWCHVMAHESFEDQVTAGIMNEHYINIKVDREERPDLDSLYMTTTVAMTGRGGWPMSVFLTPDLEPFFAGTYFPPEPRYQMPSFKDVLISIATAWKEKRRDILQTGAQVREYLLQEARMEQSKAGVLTPDDVDRLAAQLVSAYDFRHGGWGDAPKFPQPMLLEFLLNRSLLRDRDGTRQQKYREVVEHALTAMAAGGLYDILGGGFARYSTDVHWLVPHFEKMLYDNAQLALIYLHAFLVTGNVHYRQVCEETLTFIQRELSDPAGGFYSSLDADSEGQEGKFYVWNYAELENILKEKFDLFKAAYGLTPGGNWEGKIVLQRKKSNSELGAQFHLPEEKICKRLTEGRQRLLVERDRRMRPAADDKVLTSWNALALMVFAEAGHYLQNEDFLATARKNAYFLLNSLYQDGRLLRSWRAGVARHNAFLEDYAALMLALLALYQNDPDPAWYQWALNLGDEMVAHFHDPQGGFFDTRADHEQLLVRPKDLQDNATPSGNALAACALLQAAAFGDRLAWRELATEMFARMNTNLANYPSAYGKWLQALDFSLAPVQEVAILGNPNILNTQQMLAVIQSNFHPYRVVAVSGFPPPATAPALVKNRPLLENQATAYVCQNFVCQRPVNTPDEFSRELLRTTS